MSGLANYEEVSLPLFNHPYKDVCYPPCNTGVKIFKYLPLPRTWSRSAPAVILKPMKRDLVRFKTCYLSILDLLEFCYLNRRGLLDFLFTCFKDFFGEGFGFRSKSLTDVWLLNIFSIFLKNFLKIPRLLQYHLRGLVYQWMLRQSYVKNIYL